MVMIIWSPMSKRTVFISRNTTTADLECLEKVVISITQKSATKTDCMETEDMDARKVTSVSSSTKEYAETLPKRKYVSMKNVLLSTQKEQPGDHMKQRNSKTETKEATTTTSTNKVLF